MAEENRNRTSNEPNRDEAPNEPSETDERSESEKPTTEAQPSPYQPPSVAVPRHDEEQERERERDAQEMRALREREREREREAEETKARRIASAAQAIALLVGIAYVAVGSIALSRGGFDDLNVPTSVIGLGHTPLLGLLELTFGTLLILAASLWALGRIPMVVLGVLVLLWGIALAISPSTFESALGVDAENGWVYIVTGIITLVAAFATPPQERLTQVGRS